MGALNLWELPQHIPEDNSRECVGVTTEHGDSQVSRTAQLKRKKTSPQVYLHIPVMQFCPHLTHHLHSHHFLLFKCPPCSAAGTSFSCCPLCQLLLYLISLPRLLPSDLTHSTALTAGGLPPALRWTATILLVHPPTCRTP